LPVGGLCFPELFEKLQFRDVQLVVFLSDEIFAKNIPILVTVDPISSAILRIELADSRKVEDWKNHWECLTYLLQLQGSHRPQTLVNKGSGFGNVQNVVPQKNGFMLDI
jgi:hypothetical protein